MLVDLTLDQNELNRRKELCKQHNLDERNYKIMQMSGIPKIAEINRKIKGE